MLNELLEVKEYLVDPKSDKPRLQPRVLTQGFKIKSEEPTYNIYMLDQVLMVILRDFLFAEERKDLFFANGMITEEAVDSAIQVLNLWCGFGLPEGQPELTQTRKWLDDYPDANGWLKKYLIHHYAVIKKVTEKKAEEEWTKRAELWGKKYNSNMDYTTESVTFQNMIAGAISKGPLCERYLIVEKKQTKEAVKTIEDLYGSIFPHPGAPQRNKDINLWMVRNIAAFLIWQGEHPGRQNAVLLQRLRLLGWYGLDEGSGKAEKWWFFDSFHWDERPIISRLEGTDFAKIEIDTAYLEHFGFRLIRPEEEGNYMDDYWILKDEGHGDDHPFTIVNK